MKVIDEPGTKHSAVPCSSRTSGRSKPNITVDLGLRWEYYTPLTGTRGPGSLSNYDPATNTLRVSGYGTTSDAVNVKNTFTNFNARTGISWRLNNGTVVRAGYGAEHDSVPRQPVCVQLPGQAELRGLGRRTGSKRPDRWLPASRRQRS